ncbi:MAG: hypothetical protein U9P70_01850 [Patescibacteria group bacterium]|nr:hypothetical protein [Patescibacteria group bacterium]
MEPTKSQALTFFKSLFIKFEITKGSTALTGQWSQRNHNRLHSPARLAGTMEPTMFNKYVER